MALLSRLVRRNGSYCFRVAVPKHLVLRVGRTEIRTVLNATDMATAKMQTRLLSNAFDRLFDVVVKMPELTINEINDRIRGYFQQALNQSWEHALMLPTDPMVNLNDEVAYLRQKIGELQSALARQSFSNAVLETAKSLLVQLPPDAPQPSPEAVQIACGGILRADIENARILAAKFEGRYAETAPVDPLFSGMTPTGLPPLPGEIAASTNGGMTFKELADRYHVFKAKGGWAQKTELDSKRALALAFEVISPNKPVNAINAADVQAVRDLIGKVPPNLGKKKGTKTISTAQAVKGAGASKSLSLLTQEKMLRFFKAVLRWACDEGVIDKMPGEKVKVAGVNKINAIENRSPYSKDQLTRIFTSPLFTGHKSESRRSEPGEIVSRDGKFWIPLVALFTGLRAGEIVQLLKADIRQEEGVFYFDVTKTDDDDKKLKTMSSIRRVPVHAELINLGFLQHVDLAKDKGRIFADIAFGHGGYPSHNWSKWWGRYVRQIKVQAPKTAFHSFRHNFKDGLQNAKVPEYVSHSLMGHSDNSVHASYGSKLGLALLKEEIDKVAFPELEQCLLKLRQGAPA